MTDAQAPSERMTEPAREYCEGPWLPITTAPTNATHVLMRVPKNGWPGYYIVVGHWAQDLSGSEQPAFRGWFRDTGYEFAQVMPEATHWQPIASAPDMAKEIERLRAALESAALFLEIGAVHAPNDGVDLTFVTTDERLKTRGLADVMNEVAANARAALANGRPR